MRIAYLGVQFELTRRCNQNCLHCCRGNSQDLDLSTDVVDAFFDKNDIHSIGSLKFSGGEPTLNGKILEYLITQLVERNIEVFSFMVTINGLSYSESLVTGLNKLNEHCKKYQKRSDREQCGILFVSQSQYHQPALKDVIERFSELPYFIAPIGIDEIESEHLLSYGNAAKNNLTTNQPNLEEVTNYDKSIKITEHEGETFIVFKNQYISSNGNVLTDGCISYDMMDKYHIGNVMEKSMIEMYSEQPKILQLKNR